LREVLVGLAAFQQRLVRAAMARMHLCTARLQAALHRRAIAEPLTVVRRREQVLDSIQNTMHRRWAQRLHAIRRRLDRCEALVRRIAPHDYLRRTAAALDRADHALWLALSRRITRAERTVGGMTERLARLPLLSRLMRAQQQTEHLSSTIPSALRHRLSVALANVDGLEKLLHAVSHQSVLARGYSITRLKKGRVIVRSARDVADGDRLVTHVSDGEFESRAVNINQMELFE
jgi:exodeoxyribonuclease VII large subunit